MRVYKIIEISPDSFGKQMSSLKYEALIVVVFWWAVTCLSICACSCTVPPLPKNIEQADAIFSGKVVSVEYSKEWAQLTRVFPYIRLSGFTVPKAEFVVSTVWKGEVEEREIVEDSLPCGFHFEENKEYLVYAGRTSRVFKPHLGTWSCSGTKDIAYASEDLDLLGVGRTPYSHSSQRSYLWGILGGMAVATAVLLLSKQARRQHLKPPYE